MTGPIGPTPPPRARGRGGIILVAIVIVVVLGALIYGTTNRQVWETGKPSFVIEKIWFVPSNRTVYIDFKNIGGATAHKVGFDVSPGQVLILYPLGSKDLGPGRTLHISVSGAEKNQVANVYLDYDEGFDTFSIPWVRPDVGTEETLTNIYPGIATETMGTVPATKGGVLLACHVAYPTYTCASPPFTATTSTVKITLNVTTPASMPAISTEYIYVSWFLYRFGTEINELGWDSVEQVGKFEFYVHGLVAGEKYYIHANVGDADCDFIVEEA